MNLTSEEKYLVDTNVLVYSIDQNSPFYSVVRELLEQGLQEGVRFVVAQQNLLEFVAVLTRGYGVETEQVLEDAEAFASQFEVISPFPATFEVYVHIARSVKKRLYPFDMYLAATMLENDVFRIITANAKDFQGIGLEEIVEIKA